MPETVQSASAVLSVVDKLRMLLDITKTISRSLDLDEVLNLVMDTLDSLVPYDAAGIYLVKCSRAAGRDAARLRRPRGREPRRDDGRRGPLAPRQHARS